MAVNLTTSRAAARDPCPRRHRWHHDRVLAFATREGIPASGVRPRPLDRVCVVHVAVTVADFRNNPERPHPLLPGPSTTSDGSRRLPQRGAPLHPTLRVLGARASVHEVLEFAENHERRQRGECLEVPGGTSCRPRGRPDATTIPGRGQLMTILRPRVDFARGSWFAWRTVCSRICAARKTASIKRPADYGAIHRAGAIWLCPCQTRARYGKRSETTASRFLFECAVRRHRRLRPPPAAPVPATLRAAKPPASGRGKLPGLARAAGFDACSRVTTPRR